MSLRAHTESNHLFNSLLNWNFITIVLILIRVKKAMWHSKSTGSVSLIAHSEYVDYCYQCS